MTGPAKALVVLPGGETGKVTWAGGKRKVPIWAYLLAVGELEQALNAAVAAYWNNRLQGGRS